MSALWSPLHLAACAFALAWGPTSAPVAPATAPPGGEVAQLRAEVERLREEVRAQRELILELMQAEQQRSQVFRRHLRANGIGEPAPEAPPAASGEGAAEAPGRSSPATATLSGRVRANGAPLGEAYVYVEGRIHRVSNRTLEIKQRGKQFSPRVLVAQVGTRLVFPNQDTVIHNVFSSSPGNGFDLGSIKGGVSTSPVVLARPGPVEIFCNIHSKMRADVLVVPNTQYARVGADGSFQISGVPVGSRRVVLWGPTLKPVRQQVEVTSEGATVTFSAEALAIGPHLNKRGQAYGSYDE